MTCIKMVNDYLENIPAAMATAMATAMEIAMARLRPMTRAKARARASPALKSFVQELDLLKKLIQIQYRGIN